MISHIHRLALFYTTTPETANQIIKTQQINLRNTPFGAGACFTFTLLKINESERKTTLVANVYVGNYIVIRKEETINKKFDITELKQKNINSIIYANGYQKIVVCFDANRIKDIKYAYGERPEISLPIERKKRNIILCLFKK